MQNTNHEAEGVAKLSEQLVLVEHGIELWSGQARLENGDFNITDGKSLLKEDVRASSGQKWLIDKAKLAPFAASKKRFISILENNGIRFMGGYAVPAKNWSEIRLQLDAESQRFEEAKSDFLLDYEGDIEAWAASHPRLCESIRSAAPEKASVEKKIRTGYMAVRLSAATPEEAPVLEEKLSGLSGQLVTEIRTAASVFVRTVMNRSTDGSSVTSVKQLSIISNKLRGLAFLAPGCLPFAEKIDATLAKLMNSRGNLDKGNPQMYQKLLALTGILTNEVILSEILSGTRSMDEVGERLNELVTDDAAGIAKAVPAAAEVQAQATLDLPKAATVKTVVEPVKVVEAPKPVSHPAQSADAGYDAFEAALNGELPLEAVPASADAVPAATPVAVAKETVVPVSNVLPSEEKSSEVKPVIPAPAASTQYSAWW